MNIQNNCTKFKAHDTLKEFIKDELSSLEKLMMESLVQMSFLVIKNNANSIKKVEVVLNIPGQT